MPTVPAAVAGSLEVDLSALPAPEETVFANSCSIIDYGLHLELFFWHHRPKGRTEPVLSVMVPIDAAVVYLWGTSREFQQQEESIYKAAGISIPEVAAAQLEVESPRILPANVFRIARTGVEASLELYFLPPYATFVAALRKAKTVMEFEPMIRVQLPGPVLTSVLRRVDSMVPELKSRLGDLLPTVTMKRRT